MKARIDVLKSTYFSRNVTFKIKKHIVHPLRYVETTTKTQKSQNVIENTRIGFSWILIQIYIHDLLTYDNCMLPRRLNSYTCHLNQKPKITIEESPSKYRTFAREHIYYWYNTP